MHVGLGEHGEGPLPLPGHVVVAAAGLLVVLEAVDGPGQLMGWDLDADGSAEDLLACDLGGVIKMEGKEVFKHAVTNLAEVIDAGWISKEDACQGVAAGTVAACD